MLFLLKLFVLFVVYSLGIVELLEWRVCLLRLVLMLFSDFCVRMCSLMVMSGFVVGFCS